MTLSEPGSATSDTAGLALLLAAVALLVNGATSGPAVLLPAAAAGLAAGRRLNLLVPVLALAGLALVLSPRRTRISACALWLAGLTVTGSFWYLRNAVIAHNPLPWFRLGAGPVALAASSGPSGDCGRPTLAHLLTSTRGLSTVERVLPSTIGRGSPFLLLLAGLGLAMSLVGLRDRRLLLLAGVALVNATAYVLTPGTGTYTGGCLPFLTRFSTPSLALTLVAVPIFLSRFRAGAWQIYVLALFAIAAILTMPLSGTSLAEVVATVLVVVAATFILRRNLVSRRVAAAAGAAIAVAAVAAAYQVGNQYLRDRYARGELLDQNLAPAYRLLRTLPESRIAVQGFVDTYPLYGATLQHRVEIAVLHGPHGTFRPITSCTAWQRWLAQHRIDYVVLSPDDVEAARWTTSLTGARQVLRGKNLVFKLAVQKPVRASCQPAL